VTETADDTNVVAREQTPKEGVTPTKSVEGVSETTNVDSNEVVNKLVDSMGNNDVTDASVTSKNGQVANESKEMPGSIPVTTSTTSNTDGINASKTSSNDFLTFSAEQIKELTLENFEALQLSDETISKLSDKQLVALNSNDNFYQYNQKRIGNQVERSNDGITDRSAYIGRKVSPDEAEVTIKNKGIAGPPTLKAQILNFDIRFYKGIHNGDYFFVESQDLPVELPPVFLYEINGKRLPVMTVERLEYDSDYYKGEDSSDPTRFDLSAVKGFVTKKYKYKVTFTENVEGLENIRAHFTRTFSNQTLAVAQDMQVHQRVKINDDVKLDQQYILPAFTKTSAGSYYKSDFNDGTASYLRMNATVYDMRDLGTPEERKFSKDVKSEGIMTFNGEVGGLPNGFVAKFSSKDSNPNPYIWDNVNMVGQRLPVYYIAYDMVDSSKGNSNDGTVYVTPDDMYMIIESISKDHKEMTVRFVGDYSKPGWIVNGTLNPELEPEGKSSKFSVKFTKNYNSARTTLNGDPESINQGYTSISLTNSEGQPIVKKQPQIGGYYRYTQSEKFSSVPVEITNSDQVGKGTVIVNYIDITGKLLKAKDATVVVKNADVGAQYDATIEKFRPQTIIKDNNGEINTYQLVSAGVYPIGLVGTTGELIEDVDNNDIISYSDAEGIKPIGKVVRGKGYITYVYKELNGNVNVTYKDIDGNIIKFIQNDQYISNDGQLVAKDQPVGDRYNATSSDYKPAVITDITGKIYQIVKGGIYQVGEVDNSGHLVSSAPMTGKVLESPQTVTYIYKLMAKKGSVDVTYVTEDGQTLEATTDVVKDGEIGTDYTTSEKTFDGYHFVRMGEFSADAQGKVGEGLKHVIYVYAKDPEVKKGSVDVTYVTEGGDVLEATTPVVTDKAVGTDYTTDQKVNSNTTQKYVVKEGDKLPKMGDSSSMIGLIYGSFSIASALALLGFKKRKDSDEQN
ncbi:MucBP domain-containing protein, partial [Enterococcus faecium]